MTTKTNATARARTDSRSWIEAALSLMEQLHAHKSRVTGEDVRFWLRSRRFRAPAHPNTYGALIRTAIGRGLLRPLGEYRPMRASTSHGRITQVYAVNRTQHLKKSVA